MLNPEQSAILAKAVYKAANEIDVRVAFRKAGLKANVIATKALAGTIGGHLIRKNSACAMAASYRYNNWNHLFDHVWEMKYASLLGCVLRAND